MQLQLYSVELYLLLLNPLVILHVLQAVDFLKESLDDGNSPPKACLELVDECLAADSETPASNDNITVMLVLFKGKPGADAGTNGKPSITSVNGGR